MKRFWTNQSGNLDNVFDTLEQCQCDVSYLKLGFFPWRMINEMRAQRIETLVLSFTEKVNLDAFDWLKQLGRLKKLKLVCFNKKRLKLKLNALMDNAPPTLKTLSLVDLTISIYMRYKGSTTIDILSLSRVEVPHNIGPFLSRHFPALTRLKLCHCDLLGSEILMPTRDLDYVYFCECATLDSYLSVTTQSERRLYRIKDDFINRTWYDDAKTVPNFVLYVPFEEPPVDDINLFPLFRFHFRSVKKLDFFQ